MVIPNLHLQAPGMSLSEIEAHELEYDELSFLATMLAAMNNELSRDRTYNFREVRATYVERGADIEKLKREDYAIEHRLGRGRGDLTYTVTPKGRDAINDSLKAGSSIGDIGDGMPHRYGADYVQKWFKAREDIVEIDSFVQPPVSLDVEALVDIIGVDDAGEPRIIVEVEGGMSKAEKEEHGMSDRRPGGHDYQSLLHDHDVMARTKAHVDMVAPPEAIWVVRNKAIGKRIVGALAYHERIHPRKETVQRRYEQDSATDFRARLSNWGCPGMDAIYTFTTVRDEFCPEES